MTPAQVCAVLAITRETFYRLITAGDLPAVGGRSGIRVTEPALEEYIAARLPAMTP